MDTHQYAVLSVLNTLFRARHHAVKLEHLVKDLALTEAEVGAALVHLRARRLVQDDALRLTLSGLAIAASLEAEARASREVA